MSPQKSRPSSLKTFFTEHKPLATAISVAIVIILILIVVIFTTIHSDDGTENTDSRAAEASIEADQKALQETEAFGISAYLPIVSADPAYTISYTLDRDDAGNYTFHLTLSALSASARDAMVSRLLSTDFGSFDPLSYDLEILNYYNPFSTFTLENLASGELPAGFSKSSLYKFGDSPYTVQTLTHTLYDGSTNTYRYILENGQPKTLPKLLFTYKELDFLDQSTVKSLNTLD